MKNSLIEKLKHELSLTIESERQVVYILIQLRKLLDLNGDFRKYPSLRFHCDWVAHVVLDREAAQNIVKAVDDYERCLGGVRALRSGNPVPDEFEQIIYKLGEILALLQFRKELQKYLEIHNLSSEIAADVATWTAFLSFYLRVIEQCPLKCINKRLKYVDEVTIQIAPYQFNPLSDPSYDSRLTVQ
jgi:hypothetical protein